MKNKRVKAIKRYGPTVVFWLIIALAATAIFLALFTGRGERADAEPEPTPLPPGLFIITPEPVQMLTQEEKEEALVRAVVALDAEAGLAIDCGISYGDLLDLSRLLMVEKGPYWPESFIMAIGEVALNRVASPEYPDTLSQVLRQTGQYETPLTPTWVEIQPTEDVVRMALRLLKGERVLNDPRVVFQALFPQGSRTILEYTDVYLDNTTYFCWTNNPEYYEEVNG